MNKIFFILYRVHKNMNELLKKLPAGVHPCLMPGIVGDLEVEWNFPCDVDTQYLALIGHPHSLQGGTMQNKVVTTLVRLFSEFNVPSVRFNFRGVGQSAGTYDAGIGESLDMLVLANAWLTEHPTSKLFFAGFSFGSYVAYRAAAQIQHGLLLTVAPSVQKHSYQEFANMPAPWIIAHGDQDQVVPVSAVLEMVESCAPNIILERFPLAEHFFHGQLIELKTRLAHVLNAQGIFK